jgi:hypothetical protein
MNLVYLFVFYLSEFLSTMLCGFQVLCFDKFLHMSFTFGAIVSGIFFMFNFQLFLNCI